MEHSIVAHTTPPPYWGIVSEPVRNSASINSIRVIANSLRVHITYLTTSTVTMQLYYIIHKIHYFDISGFVDTGIMMTVLQVINCYNSITIITIP